MRLNLLRRRAQAAGRATPSRERRPPNRSWCPSSSLSLSCFAAVPPRCAPFPKLRTRPA